MTIKQNADYSPSEYETMGDTLRLIIKRAERGLMYGPDMPSSRAVQFQMIAELCDWAKYDANVLKIAGGK